MQPEQPISNVIQQIAQEPAHAFDVFGPTVGFLTWPDDVDANFCVMWGVVPPGRDGAATQP